MPKKLGVNSKSVEAKTKKDEAKKGRVAAAEKEQEDRAWREAGEGTKTRAQAKKEEQVRQSKYCTGLHPGCACCTAAPTLCL
jgi:hypothetical protein